jgi:hypothetical protein
MRVEKEWEIHFHASQVQKTKESDRLRKSTKLWRTQFGCRSSFLSAAFIWQTLCQPAAAGREEKMNEPKPYFQGWLWLFLAPDGLVKS